ncbi:MAG: LysM peptidoglycan-binding domain-containing protein [Planctomycetes bacterium]|nr:LysM peptidoglycan-binding domain-containing protein [Planctomycetota bacterium]
MGGTARLGVVCLMLLAVGLARLVEVELDPGTPPALVVPSTPKPVVEESPPPPPRQDPDVPPPGRGPAAPLLAEDAAWPQGSVYVVKQGETLGTISQKVYGTTKHWKRLQEENRDVIPDPSRMRAGVKLRLPRIEGTSRGR